MIHTDGKIILLNEIICDLVKFNYNIIYPVLTNRRDEKTLMKVSLSYWYIKEDYTWRNN